MNLTANFTYDEMIASEWAARHGVSNACPDELMPALRRTAQGMQRIREALGVPVIVTSGYRSPTVNQAVGGSRTSQHMKAEACDFRAPAFGPPAEVAAFLAPRMAALDIDQLILEFNAWVHVSFSDTPRRVALTIRTGTGYLPGIVT